MDTTSGKINWCQTWPANTQGARVSQLALCIQRYVLVIDRLLTFSHMLYWKNIWGPRGNCVVVGFASNRTALFWLFLNTFLPTMGVRYTIGTFCQYFSPISGMRLIHACDLYTGVYGNFTHLVILHTFAHLP